MELLEKYQLILVDMDGTLYFQRPLQMRMAMRMIGYTLRHRKGIQELLIIYHFRKLREKWSADLAEDILLYQTTAQKTGHDEAYVADVVKKWIHQEPLRYLRKYRDDRLCERLQVLQNAGIRVVIYSDYPASEKARALEIPDFPCYYGGQPEINSLKPDPRGIRYILSQYEIKDPKKVIMVGDRLEKDGQAANRAGVDFLILRKSKAARRIYDRVVCLFSAHI